MACYKNCLRVLPVARRGSLCVYNVLDGEEHGVMFVLTLQRLQRYLFVYLSSKIFPSLFKAFRRRLIAIGVSYAI